MKLIEGKIDNMNRENVGFNKLGEAIEKECKHPAHTKKIVLNPYSQPTKEQLKEIESVSRMPIRYTEDAPELTDEELSEFKPINISHSNRKL